MGSVLQPKDTDWLNGYKNKTLIYGYKNKTHYFAYKGLYSENYGFSSSQV